MAVVLNANQSALLHQSVEQNKLLFNKSDTANLFNSNNQLQLTKTSNKVKNNSAKETTPEESNEAENDLTSEEVQNLESDNDLASAELKSTELVNCSSETNQILKPENMASIVTTERSKSNTVDLKNLENVHSFRMDGKGPKIPNSSGGANDYQFSENIQNRTAFNRSTMTDDPNDKNVKLLEDKVNNFVDDSKEQPSENMDDLQKTEGEGILATKESVDEYRQSDPLIKQVNLNQVKQKMQALNVAQTGNTKPKIHPMPYFDESDVQLPKKTKAVKTSDVRKNLDDRLKNTDQIREEALTPTNKPSITRTIITTATQPNHPIVTQATSPIVTPVTLPKRPLVIPIAQSNVPVITQGNMQAAPAQLLPPQTILQTNPIQQTLQEQPNSQQILQTMKNSPTKTAEDLSNIVTVEQVAESKQLEERSQNSTHPFSEEPSVNLTITIDNSSIPVEQKNIKFMQTDNSINASIAPIKTEAATPTVRAGSSGLFNGTTSVVSMPQENGIHSLPSSNPGQISGGIRFPSQPLINPFKNVISNIPPSSYTDLQMNQGSNIQSIPNTISPSNAVSNTAFSASNVPSINGPIKLLTSNTTVPITEKTNNVMTSIHNPLINVASPAEGVVANANVESNYNNPAKNVVNNVVPINKNVNIASTVNVPGNQIATAGTTTLGIGNTVQSFASFDSKSLSSPIGENTNVDIPNSNANLIPMNSAVANPASGPALKVGFRIGTDKPISKNLPLTKKILTETTGPIPSLIRNKNVISPVIGGGITVLPRNKNKVANTLPNKSKQLMKTQGEEKSSKKKDKLLDLSLNEMNKATAILADLTANPAGADSNQAEMVSSRVPAAEVLPPFPQSFPNSQSSLNPQHSNFPSSIQQPTNKLQDSLDKGNNLQNALLQTNNVQKALPEINGQNNLPEANTASNHAPEPNVAQNAINEAGDSQKTVSEGNNIQNGVSDINTVQNSAPELNNIQNVQNNIQQLASEGKNVQTVIPESNNIQNAAPAVNYIQSSTSQQSAFQTEQAQLDDNQLNQLQFLTNENTPNESIRNENAPPAAVTNVQASDTSSQDEDETTSTNNSALQDTYPKVEKDIATQFSDNKDEMLERNITNLITGQPSISENESGSGSGEGEKTQQTKIIKLKKGNSNKIKGKTNSKLTPVRNKKKKDVKELLENPSILLKDTPILKNETKDEKKAGESFGFRKLKPPNITKSHLDFDHQSDIAAFPAELRKHMNDKDVDFKPVPSLTVKTNKPDFKLPHETVATNTLDGHIVHASKDSPIDPKRRKTRKLKDSGNTNKTPKEENLSDDEKTLIEQLRKEAKANLTMPKKAANSMKKRKGKIKISKSSNENTTVINIPKEQTKAIGKNEKNKDNFQEKGNNIEIENKIKENDEKERETAKEKANNNEKGKGKKEMEKEMEKDKEKVSAKVEEKNGSQEQSEVTANINESKEDTPALITTNSTQSESNTTEPAVSQDAKAKEQQQLTAQDPLPESPKPNESESSATKAQDLASQIKVSQEAVAQQVASQNANSQQNVQPENEIQENQQAVDTLNQLDQAQQEEQQQEEEQQQSQEAEKFLSQESKQPQQQAPDQEKQAPEDPSTILGEARDSNQLPNVSKEKSEGLTGDVGEAMAELEELMREKSDQNKQEESVVSNSQIPIPSSEEQILLLNQQMVDTKPALKNIISSHEGTGHNNIHIESALTKDNSSTHDKKQLNSVDEISSDDSKSNEGELEYPQNVLDQLLIEENLLLKNHRREGNESIRQNKTVKNSNSELGEFYETSKKKKTNIDDSTLKGISSAKNENANLFVKQTSAKDASKILTQRDTKGEDDDSFENEVSNFVATHEKKQKNNDNEFEEKVREMEKEFGERTSSNNKNGKTENITPRTNTSIEFRNEFSSNLKKDDNDRIQEKSSSDRENVLSGEKYDKDDKEHQQRIKDEKMNFESLFKNLPIEKKVPTKTSNFLKIVKPEDEIGEISQRLEATDINTRPITESEKKEAEVALQEMNDMLSKGDQTVMEGSTNITKTSNSAENEENIKNNFLLQGFPTQTTKEPTQRTKHNIETGLPTESPLQKPTRATAQTRVTIKQTPTLTNRSPTVTNRILTTANRIFTTTNRFPRSTNQISTLTNWIPTIKQNLMRKPVPLIGNSNTLIDSSNDWNAKSETPSIIPDMDLDNTQSNDQEQQTFKEFIEKLGNAVSQNRSITLTLEDNENKPGDEKLNWFGDTNNQDHTDMEPSKTREQQITETTKDDKEMSIQIKNDKNSVDSDILVNIDPTKGLYFQKEKQVKGVLKNKIDKPFQRFRSFLSYLKNSNKASQNKRMPTSKSTTVRIPLQYNETAYFNLHKGKTNLTLNELNTTVEETSVYLDNTVMKKLKAMEHYLENNKTLVDPYTTFKRSKLDNKTFKFKKHKIPSKYTRKRLFKKFSGRFRRKPL